jgi:4'-phosphopantetheinyl transferase
MELLNINNDVKWTAAKKDVAFDKSAINIFRINVNEYFNQISNVYESNLSYTEIEKAFRFFKESDRKRYIVSKYALRNILSYFLLVSPAKISIYKSENKKPAVSGIEFNVTHSKSYILIGVSPFKIGIDIEHIDHHFNYHDITTSSFSPEELQLISNQNTSANFYSIWTRKEAVLKASGEGLIDNMNELNSLNSSITRKQVKYYLQSFMPDKEYAGCIAFEEPEATLNYWDYQ